MGYIKPPEPADHVVIVVADGAVPAFTWGDHRAMLKLLKEAEAGDEVIAKARERLDQALADNGMLTEPELICEYCRQKISQPHEIECRDHNDPALWVKREASGYQYLSDKFVVIHTTSVPMTDQEALEYFPIVQLMFHRYPDLWVRYITRRAPRAEVYEMMPWQYNKDVNEVFPIATSS